MRRSGALAVALTLATGLVACNSGSKKSTTPPTASGPTSATTVAAAISATSFRSDFSSMVRLAAVASQGKGLIGVLLPDAQTSRYVAHDAPDLAKAFQAAGLTASQFRIDNAQASASSMQSQAEADISAGATVLLVDALDSGSGAAIEANAAAHGVKVIDYDRLVKGGDSGRIYVSFDDVKVGQLIGQGEVDCITSWDVQKPNILIMDGDPTAGLNATLYAQGYNGVLKQYFDNGTYVKVGEPPGTWSPAVAQTTFAQQYTVHPNINSVVTPNDDNANAVIAYLQSKQIPAKTFPITGQDASLSGLQSILKGYQCGTVYKPINIQAQAAAAVALYLRAGQTPPSALVNGTTKDTTANADVQAVLLTPVWVTDKNMASTVVRDGLHKASEICDAAVASACTAAGIS